MSSCDSRFVAVLRASLAALSLLGCGDDEGDAPSFGWVYGESSPAPDARAAERESCTFDAPQLVSETVDGDYLPDVSALEHVVLLMMENRSFDHYFSGLSNPNLAYDDVAHDESNPDDRGRRIPRYHETRLCVKSPAHEWGDAHLAYAAGRLDGFVASSNPRGGRAMGYHTEQEIPFYHYLANTFAISARHFSSLLGPTQPNRLFYFLGTSCNLAGDFAENPAHIWDCGAARPSIFDSLGDAGVDYEVYDDSGIATLVVALGIRTLPIPRSISTFVEHAENDELAPVSIVGANTGQFSTANGNDDHPPFNPQRGQQFIARIVAALAANPVVWSKTALIISYDEHGGYYDHVPPPLACDPEHRPKRDFWFDQYGFRVPLFVISPFARSRYVSHYDTDHTSVLRFVEYWQNLPALTRRDANAWPLLDLFDFEQEPLPPPTWDASLTEIAPAAQAQCDQYPDGETDVPPGVVAEPDAGE